MYNKQVFKYRTIIHASIDIGEILSNLEEKIFRL